MKDAMLADSATFDETPESETHPAPSYTLPQVLPTEVWQHHHHFTEGAAPLETTGAFDADGTGNAHVEMLALDDMHQLLLNHPAPQRPLWTLP
eukprot:2365742-Pyramimonas_sp.AAC.1